MVQVEMECDGKRDCLGLEGVGVGGGAAVGAWHCSLVNLVLFVHRTTSRHALRARLIGIQLNNNTGRLVLKLKKGSPIISTFLIFFVFTSICSSKYSILGLFESHIPKCQSDFTRNGTFENGQYCGLLSQALSHFGLIRFVAPVSLKPLHVPHSQLANEHQYFSGVPH